MKFKIGDFASYLTVRKLKKGEKVSSTKMLDQDINVDYDAEGNVVGIEFLSSVKVEYYNDHGNYRKKD